MVARAMGRGAFVVFEGVDRSGKSTQSEKLVRALQAKGVKAELWRFPDRTTATGQMIDAYLKSQSDLDDAAVHLLFAANRWEKRAAMLSTLRQGTTLIVDRYAYSGAVFTAAKRIPGLDLAWSKAPDRGLPAPDAVFYLDLSPEAAEGRGGFGNERYERQELQREVRKLYGALASSVPGWTTLDAAQPAEALGKQVEELAWSVLESCKERDLPVGTVWSGS